MRPRAIETVAVIAAGDMGAAVGRHLRLGGLRVVTSLQGRGPHTAARAEAAGIEDAGSLAGAAAACDPQVPGPDAATKGRTPAAVQRALNALARSRFFAGLAERALIGDLKQVHRYLVEAGIRSATP